MTNREGRYFPKCDQSATLTELKKIINKQKVKYFFLFLKKKKFFYFYIIFLIVQAKRMGGSLKIVK